MADYRRETQRFTQPGISTRPRGAQKPGRQTFLQNLRQVTPETLEVRAGARVLSSAPFGAVVHSLGRLNDPSQSNAVRIVGAGTNLYAAHPADPQNYGAAIDTGWGGVEKPLSIVSATPKQSSRPYAYLTDGTRQRKLNTDPTVYPIGIPAPAGPPSVVVKRPGVTVIQTMATAGDWTAAGAVATAPTGITRVNTTVAAIYYDSGNTGYCNIVPTSAADIVEGMLLSIAGEASAVPVEQILIAVASTTIDQIVYDAGTSGPCSIQPAASLGTGQIEDAPLDAYRARNPQGRYGSGTAIPRGQAGVPPQSDLTLRAARRIREVDFPVNALVKLNGTETVRILSVTVNADEILSFRCVTAGTFSSGQAIDGVGPAFRVHLNATVAAGAAITASAVRQNVSSASASLATKVTGGMKATPTVNAALVGGRATRDGDLLRFQIRVNDLTRVQSIRLYLDVDPATHDFLRNYYVFEWRASDIVTAIQGTNAASISPFVTAALTALTNRQLGTATPTGTAVPRPGYAPPPATRTRTETSAQGTADQAALSAQLALGNNQWIHLECRVNQLIRVGTASGQTLANIGAVEVLVTVSSSDVAITVDYQGLYLTGGYGPDVGQVGDPYVYRYRYRSSITGEVSNPSPSSRGGVIARRQAITVTGTASSSPQADLIDWFRLGSGITPGRWALVGTSPNAAATFEDWSPDSAVDGGETLDFLDFQPWVTLQQRTAGTALVAGGAIKRLTGSNFDTAWAPGTLVLVNNRACSIDQVVSADVIILVENAGASANTAYVIPSPQKVGQPLPVFFSDDNAHLFAVGDPLNPGTLYWARFNNPDSHSDQNTLIVSPGTEPLINGAQWDNGLFLFSTRRQYEIIVGNDGTVLARPTACEKGAISPQGVVSTPYGIFFVSDDGIYLTRGGSEAVSITSEDLQELFPRDQIPGRDVGLIPTPEMGGRGRDLRLTWVDGLLYFDYEAASPEDSYRSLIFDPREGIWFFDRYPGDHEIVRLDEDAENEGSDTGGRIHRHLVALDKTVTVMEGHTDLGAAIAWIWYSPLVDYGDTRSVKQWGDTILDLDPKGSTVSVTPVFDEAGTVDPAQTLTSTGRQTWILPIRDGDGALARNMGLRASGSSTTGGILYLWEPAALPKTDAFTSRATDWDDLGVNGAKFIQGVVIRANTYGVDKTILVQGDRTTYLTLTINHNGEQEVAYPIASTGWTPFVAHLVRLWPSGDPDNWLLSSARWVWEPAPELATEWTTQPTTHDFPGYLHVRDGFFSYSDAASAITFEIVYDGVSVLTTITPASTAYARVYVIFPARKGRSVSYRWKSATPFRLYRKDTSMRVHGWGHPQGYVIASPFGGESRLVGAQI